MYLIYSSHIDLFKKIGLIGVKHKCEELDRVNSNCILDNIIVSLLHRLITWII